MADQQLAIRDYLQGVRERPPKPNGEPFATYSSEGDCICAVVEDRAYWADRVDGLVTLLRGEPDNHVIGVIIKGMQQLPRSGFANIFVEQRGAVEIVTVLAGAYERQYVTDTDHPTPPDRAIFNKYADAVTTLGGRQFRTRDLAQGGLAACGYVLHTAVHRHPPQSAGWIQMSGRL